MPSKMRHPLFDGLITVDTDGDEDEEGLIFELGDILNLVLAQVFRFEDSIDGVHITYECCLFSSANRLKLD